MSDEQNLASRRAGGRVVPPNKEIKEEIKVLVAATGDIVLARQRGRDLALRCGFSSTESTLVSTAISELARNIVLYAQSGEIQLVSVKNQDRIGIVIVARDEGPGIRELQRALMGGYSTSGGLGLGLSGVRRMVDSFDIDSKIGKGTTVTATKWLR